MCHTFFFTTMSSFTLRAFLRCSPDCVPSFIEKVDLVPPFLCSLPFPDGLVLDYFLQRRVFRRLGHLSETPLAYDPTFLLYEHVDHSPRCGTLFYGPIRLGSFCKTSQVLHLACFTGAYWSSVTLFYCCRDYYLRGVSKQTIGTM